MVLPSGIRSLINSLPAKWPMVGTWNSACQDTTPSISESNVCRMLCFLAVVS